MDFGLAVLQSTSPIFDLLGTMVGAAVSSIVVIPRTFANATTGFLIEAMGYTSFFVLCTVVAIPGMLMLIPSSPPVK